VHRRRQQRPVYCSQVETAEMFTKKVTAELIENY